MHLLQIPWYFNYCGNSISNTLVQLLLTCYREIIDLLPLTLFSTSTVRRYTLWFVHVYHTCMHVVIIAVFITV